LKEPIEDIIRGCVDGKEEFQRKLYDEFSDRMYGLCLQYSKNSEEAKDILQEGFIKVYQHIHQFSFNGSFAGWVRRVFVNTAIETFRNKKMKFSDIEIHNVAEPFAFDDIIEELSAQEILKLVQELSPRYRLVFNLYAIEGFTHKEIGKKLNISEGTSKSNLARARMILKQKLSELIEE